MEEFEIVDTSKIQLASLKNFLSALGYQYYAIDKVFVSDLWTNRSRKVISFRTAVLVHNQARARCARPVWTPEPDTVFGDIPLEVWKQAQADKIVHSVYLQCSRKKGILCTKQLVKFVHPEDADVLLKKK